MKFKKLLSFIVSAAMSASMLTGFVATASAEGETTLPADQAWTTNDTDLMAAATAAGDKAQFGPVNGLSGYGNWANHAVSATYTHTNGVTYNFTSGFQAGSGNAARRSFYFTPEQACIVTVAYAAQAGRPVYIYQGKELLASGEEGAVGGVAATITADIEDITKGDVIIYGGSSNKDIFGIFADYYDPNVVVNQTVSGAISYAGAGDTAAMKIVFEDTKDNTKYTVDFAEAYSVELRQNRTYDVYVADADGNKSETAATTLDTNSVSVAKQAKTFDINVVDIAETTVTGDVVVHDIYNDGTSLDLSKVTLNFKSANREYNVPITDNKISAAMMPNEEYTVTAVGADGYSLSPLSGSYLMAAGDTAPFKNILFTENVDAVDFKAELTVGADKEFATISDAVTAIKKMTRDAGEAGRVTVLVDPGIYTEQVIVDTPYVTIKAADTASKPEIQWYYGVGYLYYSSASTQYYNEDDAVAKTKKGTVTRWGSAVRITGKNVNMEGIIVRNTFSCFVSEAELADGSEPATHNEYSDVNGKPDRTVAGYDAMTKPAVERAAAIAMDADNIELYNCEFISSQDTFYTNKIGYVKDCYIEGGTDFIFGGNSIVFDGCTLAWHGYSDAPNGGYLTACQTSDVPVAGTPNTVSNGYLLKNCTVTNSKYYPDNKFAAGGWGRNWGGAKCQVVFDGVKLDGASVPGEWTKMGGELSGSILYVNNVTNADGSAVDVTSANPNGTMEDNGYSVMAMTDYFGDWVPAHFEGELPPVTEYKTKWVFGPANGAPEMAYEGNVDPIPYPGESTDPAGVTLNMDLSAGKLNNVSRTDNWAQCNASAKFTIPNVKAGSTIDIAAYNGTQFTVGDTTITTSGSYTTAADGDVVITCTANGYIDSITLTTPIAQEQPTPSPSPSPSPEPTPGTSTVYTWDFTDPAYFSASYNAGSMIISDQGEAAAIMTNPGAKFSLTTGKVTDAGGNPVQVVKADATVTNAMQLDIPAGGSAKLEIQLTSGSTGKALYIKDADGNIVLTASDYTKNVLDKTYSCNLECGKTYYLDSTSYKPYIGKVTLTISSNTQTEDPTTPPTQDPTPTPTPTPKPTVEPVKVDCVKITAVYKEDGSLDTASAENVTVPLTEAVMTVNGNTRIMYWESLDGMKPVDTEQNLIWKATESVAAGTVLAPGLTAAGELTYTGFTSTDLETGVETPDTKIIGGVTYGGYLSHGTINGGWSGTSLDPAKTTALKYEASANGKLTAYLQNVGNTKIACIGEEGKTKTEVEAAGVTGIGDMAVTANVEAGKTYYIFVSGSKGRFCGVGFKAE